jgi:spoIIIJ-associated protein
MREAIGTGETVELAKEAACKELGVESYEAEFEILEMPTKKTFGLFGGSPAKVRVYLEDDPAEAAAKYLQNVLSCMGVAGVQIDIRKEEGGAMLAISGDDVGFIIGHRGETLDALQYLSGLVANHVGSGYYRVTLDVGNYREKRRQTLEELGKKIAEKSLRIGRNASLEPMNPYERRIIHTAVQTVEGAKSWSEGEDLERHVVIGPIAGERNPRRSGVAPRNFNGRRGTNQRGRAPYRPPQRSAAGTRNSMPGRSPAPSQAEAPRTEPVVPSKPEPKGSLYGRIDVNK